jgi:hypothetical protein
MNVALLENWAPLRLYSRNGDTFVDWAYLGTERFTDPFFEQTITRCLRHPANVLFRHHTSIEVLRDLYEERRGLEPAGFIFHISRCGSTLMAQMLAALERNIVISEARPIDQVLRAPMADSQRVTWLRWIVSALARPRQPAESNFFIKFDAWHVLQLPLVQRAFPNVPWVFVYREPIEVMVSQQRQRGVQMVPDAIGPARFGLEPHESWITRLDEYCAGVLATLCEAALTHRGCGHGRMMNFKELPGAVTGSLPDFFHVDWTADELARMKAAAQFDAKRPGMNYENDVPIKQREANDELRRLARAWVDPVYARLEQARVAQVPVGTHQPT